MEKKNFKFRAAGRASGDARQISNFKFSYGFTLVELVVTVAVLAILATAAFAIFSSTQAKARDAKRMADVEAIANAYETNYDPINEAYRGLKECPDGQEECPPGASDFGSDRIPKPPGSLDDYLGVRRGANTTFPSFTVCATLDTEKDENGNPKQYCKSSKQGGT